MDLLCVRTVYTVQHFQHFKPVVAYAAPKKPKYFQISANEMSTTLFDLPKQEITITHLMTLYHYQVIGNWICCGIYFHPISNTNDLNQ